MDFSTLLSVAKKNSEQNKNDGKYYNTKFAPPKKVSKEKKLSDNIQKFLQKKEQEEREKQLEEKRKLANLLAMRDEKSKNKIKKMLKVTKSANKSVLDDVGGTSTNGLDEPDQDDYGYVSTEANAFYQKYIEKVKDVKDDKGFAPSRPQSLRDLSGTKERVKAAITKEIEDKTRHPSKQRIAHGTPSTPTSTARAYTSSRPLYDPEAEKREEERQKREEQAKKAKQRKPPPPPMDFQALLKLAEKKQYEPVKIVPEVKKIKEPERLLTAKEKKEIEEQRRAKEAREARKEGAAPRMEPNGRIPKLNQAPTKPQTNGTASSAASSKGPPQSSLAAKKPNGSLSTKTVPTPAAKPSSSSSTSNGKPSSSSTSNGKSSAAASSSASSSAKPASKPAATSALPKNPYANVSKNPTTTREFPPRDMKAIKPRQFPPADVQKTRQFPPPDVRRSGPSGRDRDRGRPPAGYKRRIEDDDEDEDEYDSELDDFIDDGDCGEDYSSHIKAIFGYDKSRYRDIDEEDDAAMESNFAQVQREEYISKKIGIKEDLEDMKLEAMEKKRKMAMKKRRL